MLTGEAGKPLANRYANTLALLVLSNRDKWLTTLKKSYYDLEDLSELALFGDVCVKYIGMCLFLSLHKEM